MSRHPPDLRADRLAAFREGLLAGTKRRIREQLGPQPPSIARYYRAYVRVFRAPFVPCTPADVERAVAAARVALVGDFHTNPAAQQAQQRLLEAAVAAGRRVALAVEMFAVEDQPLVDRFQAGEMPESEFLAKIRYRQSWGFRWGNFRGLLESAARLGVPVVATNRKSRRSLAERDAAAAAIVAERLAEEPETLMLVIQGDLHLAPGHLPAELDRRAGAAGRPRVVVYQDSETVFRRLERAGLAETVFAVKFDDATFCLLGTSPLAKMQGYLGWLEAPGGRGETGGVPVAPVEADEDDDPSVDFGRVARALASLLGVPAPTGAREVLRLDDPGLLDLRAGRPGAAVVRALLRDRRPFVLDDPPVVHLPDGGAVALAAASMALLLREATGVPSMALFAAGAFQRRVVARALEIFAARLVEPALAVRGPEDWRELARCLRPPVPRKLRRRAAVAPLLGRWFAAIGRGVRPAAPLVALLDREDRRLGWELSRAAGDELGARLAGVQRRRLLSRRGWEGAVAAVADEETASRWIAARAGPIRPRGRSSGD